MGEVYGGGQQGHLIVIIHGIGRHGEEKRKHYLEVLEESRKELLKDDARAPFAQSNIEFRFTEWHDIPEMSQKRTGFNYLTMPKGAKILKGVMKDVVSDFLFYAEAKHRDSIIQSVVRQINDLHDDFCLRHAETSHGNLHILAHSLGSVIAYDILASHFKLGGDEAAVGSPVRLNVDPKNLFICGSPLGLILSIRDSPCLIGKDKECRLGETRCWNVLHPVDPLAYRVEPLVYQAEESPLLAAAGGGLTSQGRDSYWVKTMPPVEVDYWKGRKHRHKTLGERAKSAKQKARSALSSLVPQRFRRKSIEGGAGSARELDCDTGKDASDSEKQPDSAGSTGRPPSWSIVPGEMTRRLSYMSDDGAEHDMDGAPVLHPSGAEGRIDFRLQRSFSESLMNLVTIIQSHRAYWFSKDFMLFLLERIVDPDKSLDLEPSTPPGAVLSDEDEGPQFEDDADVDNIEVA